MWSFKDVRAKIFNIAIFLKLSPLLGYKLLKAEMSKKLGVNEFYLTIRLRARVFYEQIVNEAQPSWLSLTENEGE